VSGAGRLLLPKLAFGGTDFQRGQVVDCVAAVYLYISV
jgi:hypothetical protein